MTDSVQKEIRIAFNSESVQKEIAQLKETLKRADLTLDIKLMFDLGGGQKKSFSEVVQLLGTQFKSTVGGSQASGTSGGIGGGQQGPKADQTEASKVTEYTRGVAQEAANRFKTMSGADYNKFSTALGFNLGSASLPNYDKILEKKLETARDPVQGSLLQMLKTETESIKSAFATLAEESKKLASNFYSLNEAEKKELLQKQNSMKELQERSQSINAQLGGGEGGGLLSKFLTAGALGGGLLFAGNALKSMSNIQFSRGAAEAAMARSGAMDIGAAVGSSTNYESLIRLDPNVRARAEHEKSMGQFRSFVSSGVSSGLGGIGIGALIAGIAGAPLTGGASLALMGLGMGAGAAGGLGWNFLNREYERAGNTQMEAAYSQEEQKRSGQAFLFDQAKANMTREMSVSRRLGMGQFKFNRMFDRKSVIGGSAADWGLSADQAYSAMGALGGIRSVSDLSYESAAKTTNDLFRLGTGGLVGGEAMSGYAAQIMRPGESIESLMGAGGRMEDISAAGWQYGFGTQDLMGQYLSRISQIAGAAGPGMGSASAAMAFYRAGSAGFGGGAAGLAAGNEFGAGIMGNMSAREGPMGYGNLLAAIKFGGGNIRAIRGLADMDPIQLASPGGRGMLKRWGLDGNRANEFVRERLRNMVLFSDPLITGEQTEDILSGKGEATGDELSTVMKMFPHLDPEKAVKSLRNYYNNPLDAGASAEGRKLFDEAARQIGRGEGAQITGAEAAKQLAAAEAGQKFLMDMKTVSWEEAAGAFRELAATIKDMPSAVADLRRALGLPPQKGGKAAPRGPAPVINPGTRGSLGVPRQ